MGLLAPPAGGVRRREAEGLGLRQVCGVGGGVWQKASPLVRDQVIRAISVEVEPMAFGHAVEATAIDPQDLCGLLFVALARP